MLLSNELGTPKVQSFRKALIEQKNFNPLIYIYDMITHERRDCKSFLEAIA